MKKALIALVILVVILITTYTQLTLFVIQPIGALPDGVTLVILRGNKLNFFDSADAFSEREIGGVSLLCRLGILGGIAKNATILIRLPYSKTLYEISTNGKT